MATHVQEIAAKHPTLPRAFETIQAERVAEEARHLLESVQAQGRAADEKVRALFTANTIFVAALVVGATSTFGQVSQDGITIVEIGDIALRSFLLIALAISLASSVMGLVPRLEIEEPDHSLFFFGHIAGISRNNFVTEFMGLSFEERARQLLTQVHVNSQIVRVKFKWIQRSSRFLLLAVALWLGALAVQYLR